MKSLILFFALLIFSTSINSQGFLKANGNIIMDGSNRETILRGIGLGGWMLQEPYMLHLSGIASTQYEIRSKIKELIGGGSNKNFLKTWLGHNIRKNNINFISRWGVYFISLPLHFN